MAMNLVSSILQSLTPDIIAKIASLLGIDRSVAQNAVSAGIPAILASFAKVASSPDGARQLSNTLAQHPSGALDQLKNAVSGSGQRNFAEGGTSMLSGLLGGSGLNALAAAIGSFAGTNTNTGKSLLGMIGPLVAGTLGQQQRSSGLDANGLASLLASQKDQIAAAMPPGFAKMLGGTGLLDALDGGLRRTADTAAAAGGRMAGMAEDAVTGTGAQAAYAASRSASSSSWPYWAIGIAALLGLGWYFLANHDRLRLAESPTTPATQSSSTVGARTPDVNSAELTTELTSSVNAVKAALQRMTNPAAAQAALPQLQQAAARVDKVNTLAAQLPPTARQGIATSLAPAMASLNQLFDKILATPGIGSVAKPTIDSLRSKLEALSRA